MADQVKDEAGERIVARMNRKDLLIVHFISEGRKYREIATLLGTTEQVIKNRVPLIYDKTGMSNQIELVLFALAHPSIKTAAELDTPLPKARPRLRRCVVAMSFKLDRRLAALRRKISGSFVTHTEPSAPVKLMPSLDGMDRAYLRTIVTDFDEVTKAWTNGGC